MVYNTADNLMVHKKEKSQSSLENICAIDQPLPLSLFSIIE